MAKITAVFLDANLPLYAAGSDSPFREPCLEILRRSVRGEISAVTDAEVFQEILHRARGAGDPKRGLAAFDQFFRVMRGRIEPIHPADVHAARRLFDRYAFASARDLLHVAVCRRLGVEEILSADSDFDRIEEVRRVDPREFVERKA